MENGLENLWKWGMKKWHHLYPDIMEIHGAKWNEGILFCTNILLVRWGTLVFPQHDTPRDVFLPCNFEFNHKGQHFIATMLLMLDKSMAGWCLKTSKLGVTKQHIWTMKTSSALHDVSKWCRMHEWCVRFSRCYAAAQGALREKCFNEEFHLPVGGAVITAHAVEVL